MMKPSSPDRFPEMPPSRFKLEKGGALDAPPRRTSGANGIRRSISISPALTRLESSHPSPLFVASRSLSQAFSTSAVAGRYSVRAKMRSLSTFEFAKR